MLDRRRLMLSAVGVGLAAAVPAWAVAQAAPSDADARLDALLTRWFYENVELSPTFATSLGIDKGERAHLAGKLEVNHWGGRAKVQLRLEDAAPA